MATNETELKPLDLENAGGEQEQEDLKRAAQTDKVVRGVNGSLAPAARKLRPLAGIIIIVIVVLAALYMRQGMANRNKKTAKQAETAKVGVGPATTVEKGLLSDQARSGLDTGQMHVPDSLTPRSSITSPDGLGKTRSSSVPPIEYKQGSVSSAINGSLSFAEQRRLNEYNREREALEAATSVKGNLPNQETQRSEQQPNDPLQAIQTALINARASQPSNLQPAGLGPQEQRTEYERQNDQDQKGDFGQPHKEESEYLGRERNAAFDKYEVKAGWLIPAVLEQQLNSDLPGLIRALVRENVYDTVSGKYILIPAGSTLVGIYKALQAVWRRVIFPDGSSLSLGGFEGDDSQGAAGFRDQVDNHWVRIFSGALLTSLFAAGIEISQGQNSSVLTQPSLGQQVGQAVGQQVGQVGVEVTRRNLNVQPTIIVRPGYRFFVRVEKDLLFKAPYSAMPLRE
jgi:type IV secretion system protein TrbI